MPKCSEIMKSKLKSLRNNVICFGENSRCLVAVRSASPKTVVMVATKHFLVVLIGGVCKFDRNNKGEVRG